jgi:hypothetical protein
MTNKMHVAKMVANRCEADSYAVATADHGFCTSGSQRLFELAREYREKYHVRCGKDYIYASGEYTFFPGFRRFCNSWYNGQANKKKI